MRQQNFQYPVKWEKVNIHSAANRISKEPSQQLVLVCECCCRRVGTEPKFTLLQDIAKKYQNYGPNVVLYFESIKKVMILIVLLSLTFTCYALYANIQGTYCPNNPQNCQFNHIIYEWSIYNIIDDQQALFAQLVLWLSVSVIIIIFNLAMRIYYVKKYRHINNQNITDADFSVIVRRLPINTKVSDVYNLANDLAEDISIQNLRKAQNLRIRDVIMIYKTNQAIQLRNKNIKQFKKAVKKDEKDNFTSKKTQKQQQFSKVAIIRFQSIHANEVLKIKTSLIERMIHYIFPFFNPRTKYSIGGKKVAIEQAPQATDIIWEHFGYAQIKKIHRKIFYFFISFIVLCISAGTLYGLAVANNALTDEQGQIPVYFSIVMTLFPFILNYIIGMILVSATKHQRLDNKTQQYIELMQKMIIYQSINLGFFSLFLPFLVKLPNIADGIKSLSLPYVVFISILTQAFITNATSFLLTYIGLYPRIWKFLVRHKFVVITQRQANALFEGPHIQFSNNYVHLTKVVWFGCLFSIISPICLPISLLGLILYYTFQKILLNRRYVIPEYGGYRLNSQFIDLLDFTPLLIAIFNIFLHYLTANIFQTEVPSKIKIILFTSLGIGLFNTLIPWSDLLDFFQFKIKADYDFVYDEVKQGIDVTYEDINPYFQYQYCRQKVRNIDLRWGNRSLFEQMMKNKLKSGLFSDRQILTTKQGQTIKDNLSKRQNFEQSSQN